MSVNPEQLEEFTGKQVILHVAAENGDAEEKEGRIEAASEAGVAFKEKGKRDVDLLMPEEIIEITLAPTKPKSLPQKKLKLVTDSTARQHLLDRHGYDRSVVNEMSDDDAFKEHNDIDHSDLGHRHEAEDEEEETSDSEE